MPNIENARHEIACIPANILIALSILDKEKDLERNIHGQNS
jgi:hypothetical protein